VAGAGGAALATAVVVSAGAAAGAAIAWLGIGATAWLVPISAGGINPSALVQEAIASMPRAHAADRAYPFISRPAPARS
jgi:hypothetical protein